MAASPVVGVFALQGDVREHLHMLRAAGVEAIPVRRPEELASVDAMVLPGGESTTMFKLATTFDLFEPLRQRVAAGMPTLGTCAGMILLADSIEGGAEGQRTLGGLDVVVRRNAFGRQVDSFEADVDFADFDSPLHAVFIRAPEVEKVGTGVEVLATLRDRVAGQEDGSSGGSSRESSTGSAASTRDEHSAVHPAGAGRIVAVRQGAVVATAFHPEVTADDRVHRYFVELIRSS